MDSIRQPRKAALILRGMDPSDPDLAALLAGTAAETGEQFFATLVENLARALGTSGAWVTDYRMDAERLRSFALWINGKAVSDFEYELAGTPCERVVRENRIVHVPERLLDLYPHHPHLRTFGAVSYLGVPLADLDGSVMGHLAVLDARPMPENPRALAVMRIFAARARAEIQRLRREAELLRFVDGALVESEPLRAGRGRRVAAPLIPRDGPHRARGSGG